MDSKKSTMRLEDLDLIKITKSLTSNIDQFTCLVCCKYYIAPETANCGHTLCHCCWSKHRSCPYCDKPYDRRNPRLNRTIQQCTQNVQVLGDMFEKLFNINLNEFLLETGELESENDLSKNVKDWLTSSQNHFSVPPHNSENSSQEPQFPNPINVSFNKIQIHSKAPKAESPKKIVLVSVPQDDWDKIEPLPDTEDVTKNKENIVGPMDIEPFYVDENEYTANNPRRSSRKRETNPSNSVNKTKENYSLEKQSSKDSSGEIDKKSNKTKQNWNNVKKMRKEFGKLNQKYRNKLNVSIEMCKRRKSIVKENVALPKAPSQVYDIDENTPVHLNEKQVIDKDSKEDNNALEEHNSKPTLAISDTNNENRILVELQESRPPEASKNHDSVANRISQEMNAETINSKHKEVTKIEKSEKTILIPFYKRGALCPIDVKSDVIKTINHIIDSNICANDDIEITIKTSNKINILIKRKNDFTLKANTDRQIQTSLGPHEMSVQNNNTTQNPKTQNIVINVGDDNNVDIEHLPKKRKEEQKKYTILKTDSEKKNTDSADTATAQFEISESVEKELSKIMECVDDPNKSKTSHLASENSSQLKTPQKSGTDANNCELDDYDIFGSESVKETDVNLLKNVEHAPSEILFSTVKTKNRTQKNVVKRDRDTNDEETLPKFKKAKLANDNSVAANETIQPIKSKLNQSESETMNYDVIMDTVFASIDADIEDIHQSQNVVKNTHMLTDHKKKMEHCTQNDKIEASQKIRTLADEANLMHQKNSENVFSVCATQKEVENPNMAPTYEKVPPDVPGQNIEDFLTPVICTNLESIEGANVINDDGNDDSDKSVVEETPQKTTSFSKTKQKSNGATKEMTETQIGGPSQPKKVLSDKKPSETENPMSIITLSDSSLDKTSKEITIVQKIDRETLETPLNINKFFDQVKHKSTPVARKSLNFDTENINDIDPEQTICSTNEEAARTSQEKEFLRKAFEKTPKLSSKSLRLKDLGLERFGELKNKKICIAGSCLTPGQLQKLKLLCARHKFTYVDKFTDDLTHLVVSVDEEKKSQRSVKYMCALASSKWIVSFEWVEKCLQSKDIIDEKFYVALDSMGEPGPMRSRTAVRKLFQGITFYCMEPFGVLDVDTLKLMLVASGGRVAKEVDEVKIREKSTTPAFLLAEPEHTQEDKFTYLAIELKIVPVNYEWVLNCLGSYTLGSIQEMLLCPSTVLPKGTETWPQVLLACEDE